MEHAHTTPDYAKELTDRAIAAMIAAIEIYNKPGFHYRAEAFVILAVNAWELLLKARWLTRHHNNISCLYVYQRRTSEVGDSSELSESSIKKTRSGNPLTYDIGYLSRKLVESKELDSSAAQNLEGILEFRDSAVHFYNRDPSFTRKIQELGMACVKNFALTLRDWFNRNLSEFDFFLMPLSFVDLPDSIEGLVLNNEERRFLAFLDSLEREIQGESSPYAVMITIDVSFKKSREQRAVPVRITDDPDAPVVQITEEQVLERYPWNYARLTEECRKRYSNFKVDQRYHNLRKSVGNDRRFCHIRRLDPHNPRSSQKHFFNPNIMTFFDQHYERRKSSPSEPQ